jgi:hypothetical protein
MHERRRLICPSGGINRWMGQFARPARSGSLLALASSAGKPQTSSGQDAPFDLVVAGRSSVHMEMRRDKRLRCLRAYAFSELPPHLRSMETILKTQCYNLYHLKPAINGPIDPRNYLIRNLYEYSRGQALQSLRSQFSAVYRCQRRPLPVAVSPSHYSRIRLGEFASDFDLQSPTIRFSAASNGPSVRLLAT